jgi:hypothetical protein
VLSKGLTGAVSSSAYLFSPRQTAWAGWLRVLIVETGPVAERLRVREIDDG